MRNVSMADTSPNTLSPHMFTACAPTPAAPIVWAMVFSDSIAAMGLSMLFLKSSRRAAVLLPSLSFIEMKEIGVDNNTDSSTEQMNDKNIAPKRYNKSNAIYY